MKIKFILLFSFQLFLIHTVFTQNTFDKKRVIETHPIHQSLVKFTENKNQWDENVLYSAQLDGGMLFLEKNCFTYNFYDKETLRKNHVNKEQSPKDHQVIRSHAFRMTFLNSEQEVTTQSKLATASHSNYFIGNDPRKWSNNVKSYKEVLYDNIYKGIDLQVIGMDNSVKYNFFVTPFADPHDIKLNYEGVDRISILKGALKIKTSLNEIIEQKPYAYQDIENKRVTVPCEFVLKNNNVSFNFPNGYDENVELVIDPVLIFACSSGSTADNFGMSATYDAQGNLYAGGTVYGIGYPATLGAYDPTFNGALANGRTDVVITKYDSTGKVQLYSTYLGGATGTEIVSSLVVNSQNQLILLGATGSSDFPTTIGCYDNTFGGGTSLSFPNNGTYYANGTDIYITKLDATGGALIGSTYVGGSANDGVNSSTGILIYNYGDYYRGEVQVDAAGDIYIGSTTCSSDFPSTPGAAQMTFAGGGMDGVVFKINSNLTSLIWSTFLGGSLDDGVYSLTVASSSDIYVSGGTASLNFPTTSGAISTVYNGGITDGFVTKINAGGSVILNCTYVGTSLYDQVFFVQQDKNDDIFILGQSLGNMPVTAGVYSNPNSKQFIWKMDNTFSNRLVSTVFGNGNGNINLSPSAFLVDNCDNIYICGWGGTIIFPVHATTGMPVTPNAIQSSTDGFNFYLMELERDCKALKYGTYFGGGQSQEHVDGGTSRFDKKGIVYQAVCSGCGGRDDFPVTPGAWPNTGADVNHAFNCNMGDFKFDFQDTPVHAIANISPNDTICVNTSVTFSNISINALDYSWDYGDGSPLDTVVSPTHTYTSTGSFTVTMIAYDDSSACVVSDTSYLTITVIPYPIVDLGKDTIICLGATVLLDAGNTGYSHLWSTGATSQTITATPTGNYWVIVTNGGICSVTDTINISPIPQVKPFGNDSTLCIGNTVTLDALNFGSTYVWSTGETTQTIDVSISGTYSVQINTGPCTIYDTINITFVVPPIVSLLADTTFCGTPNLFMDAGNPGNTYLWSTGEITQTITANTTGTFYVSVGNGSCVVADTINIQSILLMKPLGRDTTLCDGGSVTLNALNFGSSYLWSTGATSQTISLTTSGMYWLSINSLHCTIKDSINITFIPLPTTTLVKDTVMCGKISLTLDAGTNASLYLWSTGATSQTIPVAKEGTYYVTVTNTIFGVRCSTSDTSVVTAIPPIQHETDYSFCNVEHITLDPGVSNSSYLWSTGETTQTIDIVKGGTYWVAVNTNNCMIYDTIVVEGEIGDGALYFPNTFTPNGDLLNDKFNGKGTDIISYRLMIFNRWGELFYETQTLDGGWDGKHNNMPVPNDVYVYKVNYKSKCSKKVVTKIGHVTIVR